MKTNLVIGLEKVLENQSLSKVIIGGKSNVAEPVKKTTRKVSRARSESGSQFYVIELAQAIIQNRN